MISSEENKANQNITKFREKILMGYDKGSYME